MPGAPATPSYDDSGRARADRFPLALVHVALAVLGAVLAVYGAFLVPWRALGLPGFADLLAFGGNLGVGVAAARATRSAGASVTCGAAWLVVVLVLGAASAPSDEVVVPGRLPSDPAIAVVGNVFLVAGAVGALAAAAVGARFTRAGETPRQPG